MKNSLFILLCLITLHTTAGAKLLYAAKAEAGYLSFRYQYIRVDPGPDWKGYNLPTDENGINLNIINGIKLKKFFVGAGAGYLNFEGINGLSLFAHADYTLLPSKLSPVLYVRTGYSHLFNQYDGGTGTALTELGASLNYRLKGKIQLYLQSGILFTQQSLIVPIRVGVGI